MSGKAFSTPVRIMHSRQSEIVEILTFLHYSKVHHLLRLAVGYLDCGCKERLIRLFLCGTMRSGSHGCFLLLLFFTWQGETFPFGS